MLPGPALLHRPRPSRRLSCTAAAWTLGHSHQWAGRLQRTLHSSGPSVGSLTMRQVGWAMLTPFMSLAASMLHAGWQGESGGVGELGCGARYGRLGRHTAQCMCVCWGSAQPASQARNSGRTARTCRPVPEGLEPLHELCVVQGAPLDELGHVHGLSRTQGSDAGHRAGKSRQGGRGPPEDTPQDIHTTDPCRCCPEMW